MRALVAVTGELHDRARRRGKTSPQTSWAWGRLALTPQHLFVLGLHGFQISNVQMSSFMSICPVFQTSIVHMSTLMSTCPVFQISTPQHVGVLRVLGKAFAFRTQHRHRNINLLAVWTPTHSRPGPCNQPRPWPALPTFLQQRRCCRSSSPGHGRRNISRAG